MHAIRPPCAFPPVAFPQQTDCLNSKAQSVQARFGLSSTQFDRNQKDIYIDETKRWDRPDSLGVDLPSTSPFGLRKMPSSIFVSFEHHRSRHAIFLYSRIRWSVGGDVPKDLHRQHFWGDAQGELFNLFPKIFNKEVAFPSAYQLYCVDRDSAQIHSHSWSRA